MATLETFYGPEYTVVFTQDLSGFGDSVVPTSAQISALLPDERVPFQVQSRLVREGIMEPLPPLVPIEQGEIVQDNQGEDL